MCTNMAEATDDASVDHLHRVWAVYIQLVDF